MTTALCTAKSGSATYDANSAGLFQNRNFTAHNSDSAMIELSTITNSRVFGDTYWLKRRIMSFMPTSPSRTEARSDSFPQVNGAAEVASDRPALHERHPPRKPV